MVVSQRLDLKVAQGVTLTPQLREAIALLQLSNIDLTTYVQAELDQNPFLEKNEEKDGGPVSSSGGAGGAIDFESFVSAPLSFRDHLIHQIHIDIQSADDQKIALQLVDLLDEDGYLREKPEKIAAEFDWDLFAVLRVLSQLRGLEPCGVFAKDLQDCFAMQFHEKGFLGDEINLFVSNLDLVASQSYEKLARLCSVTVESICDYVDILKTLDPKPAQSFLSEEVKVIAPDVIVKKNTLDVWSVSLNANILPSVISNNSYYAEIKGSPLSKQDKIYMTNTFQRANWLVKALDQRARTILSVAQVIMKEQEPFLNRGLTFLRPLVLKQVAEAVEMHESTVSRVTNNKYIYTPWGMFELKSFFSSKLSSGQQGEEHASSAVRSRIKKIIAQEDKFKPLSDDKIVKILQSDGVCIARRTVAKYRDILKIPPTSLRRIKKVG